MSAVSTVALLVGALAVTTAAAEPPSRSGVDRATPSSGADVVGPIPIAADSVTWDPDGESKGDDDHLGPHGGDGAEFTTSDYT